MSENLRPVIGRPSTRCFTRFSVLAPVALALNALALAALVLALGVSASALAQPPAPPGASPAPASFADLADRLSATVVNISTSQVLRRPNRDRQEPLPELPEGSPLEDFFRDFLDRGPRTPRRVTSLGSGFIIDEAGYVVTNNHVIENADEITVILNDGTKLAAELVGRDAPTDLALLQVTSRTKLTPAVFGDSETARVGDWVIAIGNPFGLSSSVTAGIISARNRDINAGRYDDFIQTDASINRGNSGGPLFNMAGEVIGINAAIYSPTGGSVGIGFAIPSNEAQNILRQLRESGRIRRGWLGVRIQRINEDLAARLGLDRAQGALVAGMTDDGPADKAGLQNGDVIMSFDGREVADERALPRIVAEAEVGRTVPVEVVRSGQRRTFEVLIEQLQEDDDDELAANDAPDPGGAPALGQSSILGLLLEPLTTDTRRQFRIDGTVDGVVVIDIDAGGPASEKGIRPGDIIMEVAQQPVHTPDEVENIVRAERDAGRTAVLLQINRGGQRSYVGVRLAAQ